MSFSTASGVRAAQDSISAATSRLNWAFCLLRGAQYGNSGENLRMTCATEDYSESPYIDMCPVSKAARLEAGYLPCIGQNPGYGEQHIGSRYSSRPRYRWSIPELVSRPLHTI